MTTLPTLPTFNKNVLKNCVDVTPESLRLLFPGRKLMMSGFEYMSDVEFQITARSAASLTNTSFDKLLVHYIAFCNPCPRIGYGENERTYRGTDDPLFGAARPSFEFNGNSIVANMRTFKCVAPVMSANFSLEDLLVNDGGFIQISLYILFEANGKYVLYDLSEKKTYIESDVSVAPSVSAEPRHVATPAKETKTAPAPKTATTPKPAPAPKPAAKPEVKTAAKTAATVTPAPAPKPAAKPAEAPKPAPAPKAVAPAPKAVATSTSSSTSYSPISAKKIYSYSSQRLYGYARILNTLFVHLLSFCLIWTSFEIAFFSLYYMHSAGIGNVIGAFVTAIVLTALLEGLTVFVYVASYKDVRKKFPVFYRFKDRKSVSKFDMKISSYRIPVLVNCFYIYVALHFLSRFFLIYYSAEIFDFLCNLFF